MNPKRILLITFFVVVTIITATDLKSGSLPKPSRLLGATTVWSALSIMGEFGADILAVGFAVGFTIALVYKYYGGALTGSGTGQKTTQKINANGQTAMQQTISNWTGTTQSTPRTISHLQGGTQ